MRIEFLKGWLSSDNMKSTSNWLNHWTTLAEEAEREGCELTVFKIPKRLNHLIPEIEELLKETVKCQ